MRKRSTRGIAAVVCVGGCVLAVVFLAGQGLERASLWAAVLALPVGVASVGVTVLALPRRRALVPPDLEVPEGSVARPAETEQVVAALLGGENTVGITTELHGAGGFGKTTLARMAVADRRVRARFRGGIFLVTVGRDTGGSALAAKINDVILRIAGDDMQFTDPELAGAHLGAALETGPPRLLVVDDVWTVDQLGPFVAGGRQCVRLVTTRVPGLLGARSPSVLVDQMAEAQAQLLLTAGLEPIDPAVADGLLAVTGRWPLLLRLTNKILANAARVGADPSAEAKLLLERLLSGGPATVDDLLGQHGLDVGQPGQRAQAVRATIEASTSFLSAEDAQRFAELGVFLGNRPVPLELIGLLWQATGGLDRMRTHQLCARLHDLALASVASRPSEPGGALSLHDVVHEFLRRELGAARVAELNAMLLDALAATLPQGPTPTTGGGSQPDCAWWNLPTTDPYLWDHLIAHLVQGKGVAEADKVAGDLRWIGVRVLRFGPAAAAADLSAAGTPRADRLAAALGRIAHLLAPATPAHAVIDVLHSRVAEDPDWADQVSAQQNLCGWPRLVNRWPLPDLPDPAFRRVLTGHDSGVDALTVAPDGTWLASAGSDRTVRIWDPRTGEQRAVLSGHGSGVRALAVAPDGTWLASAGSDQTIRIWDPRTGEQQAAWYLADASPESVMAAPDGTWLASGNSDGTVRIWDSRTGEQRAVLSGHESAVRALAVAPDGTWLASGSSDQTVRIWDLHTRSQKALLEEHRSPVWALAAAPDSNWLVSGGSFDLLVRIWDASTGQERAGRAGHEGGVDAVAVAPDGTWLASGGSDQIVRIWEASTGREIRSLKRHDREVHALAAAPDGTWLASGSNDRTIRIWDPRTGEQKAVLTGHEGAVRALATGPEGNYLLSGSSDGTIRLWDPRSGKQRAVWTGHIGAVSSAAVSSDGRRVVSAGSDGTLRLWETSTGRTLALVTGHDGPVHAIALAPDGRWLISAGSDGTLQRWDLAGVEFRAAWVRHMSPAETVAVSRDCRWVATGGSDHTIRIQDACTGDVVALMRVESAIRACAWTRSAGLAAVGAGGVYMFDFIT